MEEQFHKEVRKGWRFAADAARITDENTSSEDCKHTLGEVFVAIDSDLGAVVDKEEGVVTWVNVTGGLWFLPYTLALGRMDTDE